MRVQGEKASGTVQGFLYVASVFAWLGTVGIYWYGVPSLFQEGGPSQETLMGLSLIAWYLSPAFLLTLLLSLIYWRRLRPVFRFAGIFPILLSSMMLALCFCMGTWGAS